jgi:hypothetical protein
VRGGGEDSDCEVINDPLEECAPAGAEIIKLFLFSGRRGELLIIVFEAELRCFPGENQPTYNPLFLNTYVNPQSVGRRNMARQSPE